MEFADSYIPVCDYVSKSAGGALIQLPKYVIAESSGKTIYSNQPVR